MCFTNHTISGGGASRFLRAFEEEYEDEDGVKGGDLKTGFLVARAYNALSSLIIDHGWMLSLESSPRHLLFATRSLRWVMTQGHANQQRSFVLPL
jgi:hypothetical protein